MKTKNTLSLRLPVAIAFSVACAGCHHEPVALPPAPRDLCADYISLSASLAEETVNCTGTIGPDSFEIDGKGLLHNRFEGCSAGPAPEREARFANVKRLLNFQNFGERLPKLRECLTDRYTRWRELFKRTELSSCPTWLPKTVVGDPAREGAEPAKATAKQLGKMQPKLQYIPARPPGVSPVTPFYVSGVDPKGRSVTELQGPTAEFRPSPDQRFTDIRVPEQSVALYEISYAVPDPKCTDPAVCAAQCAAFLPGFVLAAAGNELAADPAPWFRSRVWSQGCTEPVHDDPWCPPDYVHQMSVNSTTGGTVPPGDQYGHPERGKYGEHCLKWRPPSDERPGGDYETDLVLECMDPSQKDCLSRCGN